MAYALSQERGVQRSNVKVDPVGRAGYVVNPDTVTDTDENGPGTLPGPDEDGIGADGQPVEQRSYKVTNQNWFSDDEPPDDPSRSRGSPRPTSRPTRRRSTSSTRSCSRTSPAPADAQGRSVRRGGLLREPPGWVERGGNLVLTDRRCTRSATSASCRRTRSPTSRCTSRTRTSRTSTHPMTEGLRPNARQLVEAATLGYGIGNDASPMTVVDTAAWEDAGGHVIGTTTRCRPARTRRSTATSTTARSPRSASCRSAKRADPDRRRRAADADRGRRTTATGCATTR